MDIEEFQRRERLPIIPVLICYKWYSKLSMQGESDLKEITIRNHNYFSLGVCSISCAYLYSFVCILFLVTSIKIYMAH
jgi:hypothetical protein